MKALSPEQFWPKAMTVEVLQACAHLPAHECRVLVALIGASSNVTGDGEPWIVTKSGRSVAEEFGIPRSNFSRSLASLVDAGIVEKAGSKILVSRQRVVSHKRDGRLCPTSGTSVTHERDSMTHERDTCNNDARTSEVQRTQKKAGPRPTKASKKKASKPKAHPNQRAVIAMFDRAYRTKSGGVPPTWGGKQVGLANTLAKDHDVELIEKRMSNCFDKQMPAWLWKNSIPSIGSFSAAFDQIPVNGTASHPSMDSRNWKDTEVPK